jgi:hypothetical protein
MINYNDVYPILLAEFAKIISAALAALEYIIFRGTYKHSFKQLLLSKSQN